VLAAELDGLEPEVRDWEPRAALVDEGQTARLVEDARCILDGRLALEVHEERADEVAAALDAAGYAEVKVGADLAGRDRVVEGAWRPKSG
jgi:release factor glutamine methyltransferase